jgi:F-type H+-transporting ATPase subunit a
MVFAGLGIYVLGMVVLIAAFGSGTKNDEFQPQNEFYLDPWINLPGSFDITKAVLYLLIATILTIGTMMYVANRMQARPNRVQTAVEMMYSFTRDQITRNSMDEAMAKKWFPFLATIFFFILFNNLIGYIPLPTNNLEKVDIFGLQIPAFAIFAATANVSVPLVLALLVFIAYNVEGIRKKGPLGYLKSLIPSGVEGGMAAFIFVLEFMSNFMRLISLTVRLFANILAGHLIILFMSGGLAVLLGMEAIGWLTLPIGVAIFLFEVGLVAALQAFIFATLSAIYLGGAVADPH